MTAIKPEVEITFERWVMAPRFQLPPDIFGHGRLGYDSVDTDRRRRLPKFKMAATKPEVEITVER